LSDEQTDALITALNPTVTAEERALVAGRCDGVPFYIEQLVAGVSDTGVPDALYEPLFARLRASANVVPVVEAAAVIGRHVDRALLCAVVELSDDELDDVIDELEGALVFEPWGVDGWRFRHELLREMAAELAPPSMRRALHARVADALSGGAGGEPDWRLVAGHFERADRFDEAAAAYQQASAAARRRGALAEARTCLSLSLAQLDRSQPGRDRDRREMAARLERGFLTTAAGGSPGAETAADFERCLRLGGADLRDDEVFSTLTALAGYYVIRADLRRTAQVLESLRAGLEQGRPWFRPVIESRFGAVAWLRGEFDAAGAHLEAATAGMAATDQQQIEALWFQPNDPAATAYVYLGLVGMVRGDLAGAEADLTLAARRAEQLGFPQGQYSDAFSRFARIWLRIEAGQLDSAEVLVAELSNQAERHGLDVWRLAGAAEGGAVSALAALGAADQVDSTALAPHVAAMTTFVDTLRALQVNIYRTFFDSVLGRLLIAAGQPEAARECLDTALQLAQDTDMHFYDAELLRLRAHTHTDRQAMQADIGAAVDLARRQGATLFELRAALDDVALRGQPARATLVDAVSRLPASSAFPELAQAQAALKL
jgi:tetratricopeptide (TPR) repeat protein